jgi:hypothetical protein
MDRGRKKAIKGMIEMLAGGETVELDFVTLRRGGFDGLGDPGDANHLEFLESVKGAGSSIEEAYDHLSENARRRGIREVFEVVEDKGVGKYKLYVVSGKGYGIKQK